VHVAAQAGQVGVTRALLTAGADLDARFGTFQVCALQAAARNGRAGVVKMLIEHGVNVNTTDADGSTPLHCAACGGSARVIDALAKAGANVDQTNIGGDTPLHVAALWRHLHAALALGGVGTASQRRAWEHDDNQMEPCSPCEQACRREGRRQCPAQPHDCRLRRKW
ncbi:unnamed protein product, partial [Ectocarpus sp. 12 AP-2014]